LGSRLSKEESPVRDLPEFKLFSSDLIGDMHKAFEAVCAKLRLAPQSDKATQAVAKHDPLRAAIEPVEAKVTPENSASYQWFPGRAR
jgi:hypothetical protein